MWFGIAMLFLLMFYTIYSLEKENMELKQKEQEEARKRLYGED